MAALSGELRGQLERSIVAAREEAERASRTAVETLGVERREAFPGISDEDRQLRVQLRARARQLGEGDFEAGIEPLVEEIAYEGWHRMLFARFLAENGLLMHSSGVAVTLEECAELAQEEGEPDEWMVAARYASAMLPGIFRQDDPSSRVRFAPEGRTGLERILNELPPADFQADDALGWVYQFWQSKAKKAVNESEVKIGAKELPAVTQLFTDDYMVRFLLENSLGAWWAGRRPDSPLIKDWKYLRFGDDGKPAVGTFSDWPETAANVTIMDPCCGSGHFLLVAFDMLRRIRMEEAGLSDSEAGDHVLKDNLFGLEIDPRCSHIAAFALALSAWRAGGYRKLVPLNVACSGIPVKGQLEDWTKLADHDVNLQMTLQRLHTLFSVAPSIGSLVDPNRMSDPLFTTDYSEIEPQLRRALSRERDSKEPIGLLAGTAAQGAFRAAELLARSYVLVVTNVPFLSRTKQDEILKSYCEAFHPDAKSDLATAFVERCGRFTVSGGAACLVTPQNWLFQGSYKRLRVRLLREVTWALMARLGAGAFETISGEVVKPILIGLVNQAPAHANAILGLDASAFRRPAEKAALLEDGQPLWIGQAKQLENVDSRVVLDELDGTHLLRENADSFLGLGTGDYPRYGRCFWEVLAGAPHWRLQQGSVTSAVPFGGREHVVLWDWPQNRVGNMSEAERERSESGFTTKIAVGVLPGGSSEWLSPLPVTCRPPYTPGKCLIKQ